MVTVGGRDGHGDGRDGHGSWTGWSRKLDAMVTESGQKRKIYCIVVESFHSGLLTVYK